MMSTPASSKASRMDPEQKPLCLRLAYDIHLTLENPDHSPLAALISYTILCTIIASTFIFVIESYHVYSSSDFLEYLEMIAVFIFSAEYVLRFCFHHGSHVAFVCNMFNAIDLFAILPWYLEYGFGLKGLDALRVLRVLRLFRLLRHSADLKMFVTCLGRSLDSFKLLGLFLSFAVLIFSSLLWYAEKGVLDEASGIWYRSDGSESPFDSIPSAFWWSIVTMTTVGYGDTFPVEPVGKIVATFAMISGVLVLALPLSIVGTNFSAVYEERQAALAMAELGSEAQGAAEMLRKTASEVEDATVAVNAALKHAIAIYSTSDGGAGSRLCQLQLETGAAALKTQLEAISAQLRSPEFASAAAGEGLGGGSTQLSLPRAPAASLQAPALQKPVRPASERSNGARLQRAPTAKYKA